MRVGIGYDIHRLIEFDNQEDKGLILAGIAIPFTKKCVAHSDGDVAIHALIDAMLGAAALGDIGQHFPDTDPKYKNCNSLILLQQVNELLQLNQYRIENIDITIILEKPKLAPYILQMRESLANTLNISINQISIKAKTNEQLDAVGRGEAVAAHAAIIIKGRKGEGAKSELDFL